MTRHPKYRRPIERRQTVAHQIMSAVVQDLRDDAAEKLKSLEALAEKLKKQENRRLRMYGEDEGNVRSLAPLIEALADGIIDEWDGKKDEFIENAHKGRISGSIKNRLCLVIRDHLRAWLED